MIALDFTNKKVVFADPFEPSEDQSLDMFRIIEFFSAYKGRMPELGISKDIER